MNIPLLGRATTSVTPASTPETGEVWMRRRDRVSVIVVDVCPPTAPLDIVTMDAAGHVESTMMLTFSARHTNTGDVVSHAQVAFVLD